ncbi:MAG: hypothetical protein ABIF77_00260 [bacterium]
MSRTRLLLALASILALALAGFTGCSSSPTDPGGGNNPPAPRDSLGLSLLNQAVVDSAAARYLELRQSLAAPASRTALVDELNGGWTGVDSAALRSDDVCIQFEFTSDDMAVLFTDEAAHVPYETMLA